MDVLILHAIGSNPRNHWQGWLADQLESEGHRVVAPALPEAEHPDRGQWAKTAETAAAELDASQLVIVGHSLGVATGLDVIESMAMPICGFVSVSGFAYDYGAELNGYFMAERDIDFAKVQTNVSKCAVLYGSNDPYVTQNALNDLAKELGVDPIVVQNGGHLNTEAGYTEFPQLLEVINTFSK